MLNQILGLFRGPAGPRGERGATGEKGDTGPAGETGATAISIPLIKLPIDVVLVEDNEVSLNRIMDVRRTMVKVQAFWLDMKIHIQPNIRAWVHQEDVLDFSSDEFTKKHYQQSSARLTFYIGSNLEVLPNTPGHVGPAAR